MKILLVILGIICLLIIGIFIKINTLKNIEYIAPEFLSNKKILTVYYSNGSNTRTVAENLNSIVGGDLKEIQLNEKYPDNIIEMSKLVRKQMKDGYLPKIEEINISEYDIILVASPIWNFTISLPMQSFLKNNNFENKILIPLFTYSGGACKNKILNEIQNYTKAKEIKKPLYMFENGIFLTKEQIINWLNKL